MTERTAEVWVHGEPARSWEQVAQYLQGDAHDRSKVQVLTGDKFLSLALSSETLTGFSKERNERKTSRLD